MNFTSTSTGNISTYAWTFGDGTASTVKSPSHVYSAAGVYSVSLTVTGSGGSNTRTIPNYVIVTAPIHVDSLPPSAPTGLAASVGGSTSINLSWKASADDVGVSGYRIERCQGAGCATFAQIATSVGTTFSNTGLVAGIAYSYRVRATDAAGHLGAYSNTATATIVRSLTSTTTSVNATPNPSLTGAMVTFTATVSGTAPSGSVKFTDNGVALAGCSAINLTGSGNARSASCSTNALTTGSHGIAAAYAGDAGNLASTSAGLTQVVNAPINGTNVALAVNGGVASASTTNSAGFSPGSVIDNRRSGAGWGAGGGWNDATPGAFPDWIQVNFKGVKTIDHVVVYSVQDNYTNPVEPTDAMTFSLRGITDFLVQGFDGANWVTLATVSGNQRVKRTVTFAPYATDRIRIHITNALGTWSRVTEVEAWSSAVSLTASNVALAANGGVAFSSTTNSVGFVPGTVIDNKRSGAGWGAGGGWNDATPGAFPDWIQVNFKGVKTIDRAVVYSVQDNYLAPVEPTDTMTFSLRGLTDFAVQGFDGANWVTLATVSGNRLVKRSVTFAPYATDRIRINITNALANWSRVTEVEAWGN